MSERDLQILAQRGFEAAWPPIAFEIDRKKLTYTLKSLIHRDSIPQDLKDPFTREDREEIHRLKRTYETPLGLTSAMAGLGIIGVMLCFLFYLHGINNRAALDRAWVLEPITPPTAGSPSPSPAKLYVLKDLKTAGSIPPSTFAFADFIVNALGRLREKRASFLASHSVGTKEGQRLAYLLRFSLNQLWLVVFAWEDARDLLANPPVARTAKELFSNGTAPAAKFNLETQVEELMRRTLQRQGEFLEVTTPELVPLLGNLQKAILKNRILEHEFPIVAHALDGAKSELGVRAIFQVVEMLVQVRDLQQ